MAPYRGLVLTKQDAVVVIALNRIKTRNAINNATYLELERALLEAEADPSVAIAVITGNGDFFCSGTDLQEFVANLPAGSLDLSFQPQTQTHNLPKISLDLEIDVANDPFSTSVGRFMLAVLRFSKILVAAVNGPAIGIGVTLLPHCDLVFAAEAATFWTPFLRIALVPEFGSSLTLPHILGPALANDMLLASRVLTAEEAVKYGLISRVFADDRLMAEVHDVVNQIQQQPLFLQSLPLFKRMLRRNSVTGSQEQVEAVVREELRVVARRKGAGETGHALAVTMKRMAEGKEGANGGSSRSRL